MVHTCSSSTGRAEAGGSSQVWYSLIFFFTTSYNKASLDYIGPGMNILWVPVSKQNKTQKPERHNKEEKKKGKKEGKRKGRQERKNNTVRAGSCSTTTKLMLSACRRWSVSGIKINKSHNHTFWTITYIKGVKSHLNCVFHGERMWIRRLWKAAKNFSLKNNLRAWEQA